MCGEAMLEGVTWDSVSRPPDSVGLQRINGPAVVSGRSWGKSRTMDEFRREHLASLNQRRANVDDPRVQSYYADPSSDDVPIEQLVYEHFQDRIDGRQRRFDDDRRSLRFPTSF